MATDRRTIALAKEPGLSDENCPSPLPGQDNVHSRTLRRACLILGSMDALAQQLEVSDDQVKRWILAEELPPDRVFVECVEILLLFISSARTARN